MSITDSLLRLDAVSRLFAVSNAEEEAATTKSYGAEYGGDGGSYRGGGGDAYSDGYSSGGGGGGNDGAYGSYADGQDDYGGYAAEGGYSTYGYGKEVVLDYTVLSVAMWTLALILAVELVRHKVDEKVHGRPFAVTVLEGFYRELATLGIVEFVVFLIQKYAENFNKDVKAVFADVHFLLFFTAVINSVMSVVLAFISIRISNRRWVKTEELELNHYIAIREEFQRVDAEIKAISHDSTEQTNRSLAETVYGFNRAGMNRLWNNVKQSLRRPMLKRRHNRLLVQVRFHELRVHFLKANDLPLKFRISDYLKKSEIHVLKKTVHISNFAWIMVASAVNLLYFLMGITAYVTSSEKVVGTALGAIYLGICVVFVPIAWVIFRKMKWIFFQIMKMKLIDETAAADDDVADSSSENSVDHDNERQNFADGDEETHPEIPAGTLSKRGLIKPTTHIHQLDLFWGSDPHFIIGAFQFMQLGYAIAASVLLIYWRSINFYLGAAGESVFIIVPAVCYALFVLIMAQVIPRYTLCTSLGQLVNRRRLHETMAKYKLEEAKRKRRRKLEEEEIESQIGKVTAKETAKNDGVSLRTAEGETGGTGVVEENVSGMMLTLSDRDEKMSERKFVALAQGASISAPERDGSGSEKESIASVDANKMAQLAELVQTKTQDLPHLPPAKTAAQIRTERRKNRMKTMSDGVQFMRNFGGAPPASNTSSAAAGELHNTNDRRDMSFFSTEAKSFREPSTAATGSIRSRERRRLQKSVSENVSLMRSPDSSFFGPPGAIKTEGKEEDESRGFFHKPLASAPSSRPIHKSSSGTTLSALIEGIPSRSLDAEDITVPVGRKGTEFCEEKPLKRDDNSFPGGADAYDRRLRGVSDLADDKGDDAGLDESHKMSKLAELVQTKTEDLPRRLLPSKTASQVRRERRKNRIKSMSDGVQLMRNLGGSMSSLTPTTSVSHAAASELKDADDGRRMSIPPSKSLREPAMGSFRRGEGSGAVRSGERRRLRKSVSENAAVMRSGTSSFFGPVISVPSTEENEKNEEISPLEQISAHHSKPGHKSTPGSNLSVLLSGTNSDSPVVTVLSVEKDEFCEEEAVNKAETAAITEPLDNELGGIAVIGVGDGVARDQEQAKPLSDILSGDEDESSTVNTDASVGEHSDFDDLPEVAPSEIEKRQAPAAPPQTWQSVCRDFFLSSRYRFASGVFGTMVVFFVIGMRVEIMLIEGPNEIIPDTGNTWHLTAKAAFYWEVSWLSLFILVSSFSGFLFFPRRCPPDLIEDKHVVKMTVANASDIILSAVCLFLLLWAEASRAACCLSQSGEPLCYPDFGSRLCGGLGNIEPYTSLIALRVFRFRWGKIVTRILLKCKGQSQPRKGDVRTSSIAVSDHAARALRHSGSQSFRSSTHSVMSTRRSNVQKEFMQDSHEPKSLENETGTIVELWKIAISVYPDIAAKYGEFSGELLQVMLGIQIADELRGNKRDMLGSSDHFSSQNIVDIVPKPEPEAEAKMKLDEKQIVSSLALSGAKYSKLDPEARGIILAGQIGKPVRCHEDCELVEEECKQVHMASQAGIAKNLVIAPASNDTVHFELDREQDAREKGEDDDDEILNLFIDPNARLIRSMKRCERRLPPMLAKWAVVDVVMTKYELVYFDARDVDGLTDSFADLEPSTRKKRETVKDALLATKGGKGLRLRDVAVGRRVVGHLELRDVEAVKVECLSPMDEKGWYVSGDEAEDEDVQDCVKDEYWKADDDDLMEGIPRQPRNQRWKQVSEHRLKLQSLQGSLYLRFHSDLEVAENPKEEDDASEDHITRTDSLLWCQTIARICGSDQLNQHLEHLGEEGSSELRDFLEFIDRGGDSKKPKQIRKIANRKIANKMHLARRDRSRGSESVGHTSSGLGKGSKHYLDPIAEDEGIEESRRQSVVRFADDDDKESAGFKSEPVANIV